MKAAREHLFVAMDQLEPQRALELARLLAPEVGGFKIGMELFYQGGPAVVREMAALGRDVFLDLKLHDIPQTVERAVAAVAGLGARYLTVHLAGGLAMLGSAQGEAQRGGITLLGVTLLTSLDPAEAARIGFQGGPWDIVERLARVGLEADIGGFVTSGEELVRLRALAPRQSIAVPGVRRAEESRGDQRRVVTPREARRGGADLIVVGRPIVSAPHPASAARAFVSEIAQGEEP